VNRSDSDLFDTVVERLYRLRQVCGSRAFHDAAGHALVAIARMALEDAERRAASLNNETATILQFPIERRLRKNVQD
jgi:hypothetical protein